MAAEPLRDNRDNPTRGDDEGRYVMSVAVSMTGLDAHRIRKYEGAGLVTPVRSPRGQRLFSDRDIAKIHDIASLESDGINLRGIAGIMRMKERGGEDHNRQ